MRDYFTGRKIGRMGGVAVRMERLVKDLIRKGVSRENQYIFVIAADLRVK